MFKVLTVRVFFCHRPLSLSSHNDECSWQKRQLHWELVNLTRFNTFLRQIIKQCGDTQMIIFECSLEKNNILIFSVYPEKIIVIYWAKRYKKWSLVKYIYKSSLKLFCTMSALKTWQEFTGNNWASSVRSIYVLCIHSPVKHLRWSPFRNAPS